MCHPHPFVGVERPISQLIDSVVRVKCLGGRELRGSLRGYDELVNLVLDDCEEFIRGKYTCVAILLMLCLMRTSFDRPEIRSTIIYAYHSTSHRARREMVCASWMLQ